MVHLARDNDHNRIAAHLRHDEWERLCRGAYVSAATGLTPTQRALVTLRAVDERLRAPHWFSHESAALVWGLPVWRTPTATHVRQPGRPGLDGTAASAATTAISTRHTSRRSEGCRSRTSS